MFYKVVFDSGNSLNVVVLIVKRMEQAQENINTFCFCSASSSTTWCSYSRRTQRRVAPLLPRNSQNTPLRGQWKRTKYYNAEEIIKLPPTTTIVTLIVVQNAVTTLSTEIMVVKYVHNACSHDRKILLPCALKSHTKLFDRKKRFKVTFLNIGDTTDCVEKCM